jgi:hypothetical protein
MNSAAGAATAPVAPMDSTAIPPVGAPLGSLAAMPSVSAAPGSLTTNAVPTGVAPSSLRSRNETMNPPGALNRTANFAVVPQPNLSPLTIPQRHRFLEDNNNCILQQDLFDAIDDDMDL